MIDDTYTTNEMKYRSIWYWCNPAAIYTLLLLAFGIWYFSSHFLLVADRQSTIESTQADLMKQTVDTQKAVAKLLETEQVTRIHEQKRRDVYDQMYLQLLHRGPDKTYEHEQKKK